MSTVVPSIIRTAVPVLVGWLLGFKVVQILGLTEEQVTPLVQALFTVGYYAVVRFVEERFPQAGWFLGLARRPAEYVPPSTPTP